MKKILFAVFAALSLVCSAQTRVDTPAPELSFKSQPIKKALYWEQNNGKWESRKNNKLVYLGEGVDVENFEVLFCGVFSGCRYMFLDKYDFFWRYPVTQVEWSRARTMHMTLVSDSDWEALKGIKFDNPVVVSSIYQHSMSKAHEEYSFPLFLSIGETLCDLGTKETGVPVFIAKRVKSDAGDVVRFRFGAVTELIDAAYFEVPYSEWEKLFVADKSNSYK